MLGRTAAGIVLALGVALAATSCSTASKGDSVAADRARDLADQIGVDLAPPVIRTRDAGWLVATHVVRRDDPSAGVHVDALRWSGSSGTAPGAQIDVRIRIEEPSHTATTIGEASYEAGSATKCFHYDVVGYQFHDTLVPKEISCPAVTVPPTPTPTALPALPDDAEALVDTALTASSSSRSLRAALRAAFPQSFITIDTTRTDDGVLVAAVGVPEERDCLVAVRGADGAVQRIAFDPVWIEPGETGCATALYTNPPS